MKRFTFIAGLLFALGACGGQPSEQEERVHLKHGKMGSDPGLSVHGDVRVGVVRNF